MVKTTYNFEKHDNRKIIPCCIFSTSQTLTLQIWPSTDNHIIFFPLYIQKSVAQCKFWVAGPSCGDGGVISLSSRSCSPAPKPHIHAHLQPHSPPSTTPSIRSRLMRLLSKLEIAKAVRLPPPAHIPGNRYFIIIHNSVNCTSWLFVSVYNKKNPLIIHR